MLARDIESVRICSFALRSIPARCFIILNPRRGFVLHRGQERRPEDLEEAGVLERSHGRGPRSPVEQGHFPDDRRGPERSQADVRTTDSG